MVRRYGLPAKKALGQNFLTDPSILDRIVAVAGVTENTPVLEIGPGPGGLTVRLLAAGALVHAIELDRDAAAWLRTELGDHPRFCLTEGDAMTVEPSALAPDGTTRVVANLPYHVATHVLLRLVRLEDPPVCMALMFQREVAEKLCAPIPSRDVGPITIQVAVRYETRIAMRLPPGAFLPPPKVESAVVRFWRRDEPLLERDAERHLRTLADLAFQQRRKTLRNGLARVEGAAEIASEADVDLGLRPEALNLDAWLRLARAAARRAQAQATSSR